MKPAAQPRTPLQEAHLPPMPGRGDATGRPRVGLIPFPSGARRRPGGGVHPPFRRAVPRLLRSGSLGHLLFPLTPCVCSVHNSSGPPRAESTRSSGKDRQNGGPSGCPSNCADGTDRRENGPPPGWPGAADRTTTSSARAIASSRSCVTNNTVFRDDDQRDRSSLSIICRVCTSRALKGSSISKMSGFTTQLWAIATRLRIPPDS